MQRLSQNACLQFMLSTYYLLVLDLTMSNSRSSLYIKATVQQSFGYTCLVRINHGPVDAHLRANTRVELERCCILLLRACANCTTMRANYTSTTNTVRGYRRMRFCKSKVEGNESEWLDSTPDSESDFGLRESGLEVDKDWANLNLCEIKFYAFRTWVVCFASQKLMSS